jgi:hypothetical protein
MAMFRNKRRVGWGILGLAFVATLWVLNVERTYERNVRQGIPADFRIQNGHRPLNWKA